MTSTMCASDGSVSTPTAARRVATRSAETPGPSATSYVRSGIGMCPPYGGEELDGAQTHGEAVRSRVSEQPLQGHTALTDLGDAVHDSNTDRVDDAQRLVAVG